MGLDELVEEPRLAHARLPDHGHDLPMPPGRLLLRRLELLHLGVAAHEAGEPPRRRGLQPRADPPGAPDLVGLHRRGQALDRDRPEQVNLHVALGQRQRLGRDHYCAGIGDLLHPRGEMRRLADRRVVHVEIAADGAHDDLAGVQPDTDLDDRRVRAAHLFRVFLNALLHPEGGVASAHRVILMGERRAEQRHNPVAHYLVDCALVPVDGLHHPFEHRIENLARLLGIAVGEQLHGALQVCKEHRDLLALAFEGALGREDLLGEVLGSVGLGGSEPRRGAGGADGGRALEAELSPSGKLRPAVRASEGQRRRALQAELRLGRILLLAPGHFIQPSRARRVTVRTVRRT